jgi:hypothetical protein
MIGLVARDRSRPFFVSLSLPEQRSVHFFGIDRNRFHRETNERITAHDKQLQTALGRKRQLDAKTISEQKGRSAIY